MYGSADDGDSWALAEGRREIELEDGCGTVGEALRTLRTSCTPVYRRIVAEDGGVRPHVNLFVGVENVRDTGGLETPLPDGSELVVLPSVSGG